MRSYGQYCALARALDQIGERWTLLIVRELFTGDCRYSDLRDALPGIATNLLADRLRQLQADGIIESYDAARPVRATVYRLTDRGRQLGPALGALVAFGGELVTQQGDDVFRSHWLTLGLPPFFDGVPTADIAPLTILLDTGDQPVVVDVGPDGLTVYAAPGRADADVTISGDPDQVFAALTAPDRRTPGVVVQGPRDAVRRLRRLAGRSSLAASRSNA